MSGSAGPINGKGALFLGGVLGESGLPAVSCQRWKTFVRTVVACSQAEGQVVQKRYDSGSLEACVGNSH